MRSLRRKSGRAMGWVSGRPVWGLSVGTLKLPLDCLKLIEPLPFGITLDLSPGASGAPMGKSLWSRMSQGGALVMGLIGLIAPGYLARSYREHKKQVDREAEAAVSSMCDESRENAIGKPVDEIEAWNRDFIAVTQDLRVSYEKVKAKLHA